MDTHRKTMCINDAVFKLLLNKTFFRYDKILDKKISRALYEEIDFYLPTIICRITDSIRIVIEQQIKQ